MKNGLWFLLLTACILVVCGSCRRNQPSLVDANRPPDTELWYAPPDSSEYGYLVHLYWHGVDADGIAVKYLWTITDTIVEGELGWNPSVRARDYRKGHITTRTDSTFAFTAFRNFGGVGLKKNRQAFHIVAIDDNGVLDPTPARIEFVATVQTFPRMRFATRITRVGPGTRVTEIKPFNPSHLDTVGMLRPFAITYNGITSNGEIRAYKFRSLTSTVDLPGQDRWSTDLGDTIRVLTNNGANMIPSGRFRLAAQCRDDAGAESPVDAGLFTQGVCQVVVNFEPDTRIYAIENKYWRGETAFSEPVNITDALPDTVPYGSWIRIDYVGWDSPYDSSLCTEPDRCIGYQVQYVRLADQDGGPEYGGGTVTSTQRWVPDDPEDNQPDDVADSTTMNVGSQLYKLRVRAVDEYGKADGTPAEATIVGNFRPTLDAYSIVNWDGTVINEGDTIRWQWYRPANGADTLRTVPGPPPHPEVIKRYYFVVHATGHDHPKDPLGSGVKAWLYQFLEVGSKKYAHLGASDTWVDATQTNVLADTVLAVFRYSPVTDPGGVTYFTTLLPPYLGKSYDFFVQGRDLGSRADFEQFMFINKSKERLNKFNTSSIGRVTRRGTRSFHFEMRRD